MVNLRTSVYPSIAIPTRGHISKVAKLFRGSKKAWGFFKAGNKDAYKKLLRDQEYVGLILADLRNPTSRRWLAFAPRVPLFGAVSAVIHYNCWWVFPQFYQIKYSAYMSQLFWRFPPHIS